MQVTTALFAHSSLAPLQKTDRNRSRLRSLVEPLDTINLFYLRRNFKNYVYSAVTSFENSSDTNCKFGHMEQEVFFLL
jgi:hypothetical protein